MSNSKQIEREGIYKCGNIFEKIGFAFREQPIEDYGVDAIIEERENEYLSGKLIAVQIKSGESYFSEIKGDKVVFRGDIKHYKYWLNHSLPVIIVLYSPLEDKCIWEVVNEKTAERCKNGWKINIPLEQTLNEAKEKLKKLTNTQSDYEMRWNSLVVAKNWMLETINKGECILEVEEWVNKSSGRGNFKLKVEEDGNEKILYERCWIGFGTKKYEQVIQELFPWADIKIDEEFYEENIEEECYNRSKLSERDFAIMFGKKGNELLKYSDIPPQIYPYRNGAGEVDFYRLKLTLNQIGKAFIEMEHFLEMGKCYFINSID